jgi:peptidoglycan hydrolase CwlO-like protein
MESQYLYLIVREQEKEILRLKEEAAELQHKMAQLEQTIDDLTRLLSLEPA